MKGFKSFADNTTLEFEPGVTAVVGPNGSGKSNVVDAVTWVLGAQSTRALRSQKMDDVIFMGTANRAALGRAEVSLTLDNASGKLPVEGAEVTISRTLFRNGESEYAINATTCRLLDIQELLADSGVGRQQHMIIGQGQLDGILNSTPENRRAVIEEAAGVLKHRRRKERAERRLEHTHENLERLGDLVREVRRQMRPLERQAASARSYADVERDLRSARHALFAQRFGVFESRRQELDVSVEQANVRERQLRDEVVELDARASATAADMSSRREEILASSLGSVQALVERVRGMRAVIDERRRSLESALLASADETVIANLEADAAHLDLEIAELVGREESMRGRRDELERRGREIDLESSELDALEPTSDPRHDLTRVRERTALLERSLEEQRENEGRHRARLDEQRRRTLEATQRLEEVRSRVVQLESGVAPATARESEAREQATRADDARAEATGALRAATEAAARAQARAEALERALAEFSGAEGRAILHGLDGVLGAFLELIDVDAGYERAVESALGASAGATVVGGRSAALSALAALRTSGGSGLILAPANAVTVIVEPPGGTERLRDHVRAIDAAPEQVAHVLDALFARSVVAENWQAGVEVAIDHSDIVVVTKEGDRFAASGWRVASGRGLVTRASVDEAHDAAARAGDTLATMTEESRRTELAHEEAREAAAQAQRTLEGLLSVLEETRRDETRLVDLLTELEETTRSLERDLADSAERHAIVLEELGHELGRVPDLERATNEFENVSDDLRARRRALDDVREIWRVEVEELRRTEAELTERSRLFSERRRELESRLAGRGTERAVAASRRRAIESDVAALAHIEDIVARASSELTVIQSATEATYREQLGATRASAELLEQLRTQRHERETLLANHLEVRRSLEIERAEVAVKLSGLVESLAHDLAMTPADLAMAPAVELSEGVTLEHYVGELEARITSLGPINPLALEELASLEERYVDLDAQVADVRHARRELQEVVHALDEEIMTSFASAYADVNEHFSSLIAMLFPGGQGRLNLTDPEDPLNTGVEIEVRPMGRNIRRISLLSGGERSMAALAFLFAVFRSRPSPFYLMDEVEAALDDVNLQRFLSLIDEFRDEAQLLIVTHQKRTMESADALYGVTMVPGASSKVVSQRVTRAREVSVS